MKATMLNPPCWDPKMVEVKPLFTTPHCWYHVCGTFYRVTLPLCSTYIGYPESF